MGFGKLFKKKEESKTTAEAIQDLRQNEDMLLKKQEFLEKKIDSEVEIARKNAKTNKRLALTALKRKKRYEKQLQQIDGTLTTIEQQREALEAANINTTVLKGMDSTAKALKNVHKDMNVDNVHDMMDDIAEQQDVAKEISDAISNPVAFGQDFDEDELEAELNELEMEGDMEEQQKLEAELLDVGVTDDLPEIPQTEPAVAKPAAAPQKKKKPKKKDPDMAELA